MTESSKTIGDFIDEALGIKGPQDLLKLVLIGVGIAMLVVGFFISKMKTGSLEWWSLIGFEIIAGLLCISTVYVVHVVLPELKNDKKE